MPVRHPDGPVLQFGQPPVSERIDINGRCGRSCRRRRGSSGRPARYPISVMGVKDIELPMRRILQSSGHSRRSAPRPSPASRHRLASPDADRRALAAPEEHLARSDQAHARQAYGPAPSAHRQAQAWHDPAPAGSSSATGGRRAAAGSVAALSAGASSIGNGPLKSQIVSVVVPSYDRNGGSRLTAPMSAQRDMPRFAQETRHDTPSTSDGATASR